MLSSVSATPQASDVIMQLQLQFGALSFHFTGRVGGSLCCLQKGELRIGGYDVLMGNFRGFPVYMRTDDAEVWDGQDMIITMTRGHTRGFSLEAGYGYRFELRPAIGATCCGAG